MMQKSFKRILGALKSKKAGGRQALFRKGIAPFTRSIDKLIAPRQKVDDTLAPCVLLCGPPRSGSTVIYQTLVQLLSCCYVTNLHQILPRHADRLLKSDHFRKVRVNNTEFKSYYGHTRSWGDVNEGNEFADYWFKTSDRQGIRNRFIETLTWVGADKNRPAIFKNVGVYDRLLKLHHAVPELIFIRFQRDTQSVIESELNAYYELGTINPIPDGLNLDNFRDPLFTIVQQITMMEKSLDRQLSLIPTNRRLHWTYENYCSNPRVTIGELIDMIDIKADWNELPEAMEVSTRTKVTQDEARRISKILSQL